MPKKRKSNPPSVRWFETLPKETRIAVEQTAVPTRVAKGHTVIRQGDRAKGLFGVVSGELQAIGTSASGVDVLIAIHRPNDWFGFLACADGGPYAFSVVASKDCEMQFLNLSAVERIFMRSPQTMKLFFVPQVSTTRALFRYISEQASYTPIQRLASRLLDLSISPYGEPGPVTILSEVTQEQLALSIMHSRQWTNRMLRQLTDKGLISLSRGTIEIIDIVGLERLALEGTSISR